MLTFHDLWWLFTWLCDELGIVLGWIWHHPSMILTSFRHDSEGILTWIFMIFKWFWWCLRMIPGSCSPSLRPCFGTCSESMLRSSQQTSRFQTPTKKLLKSGQDPPTSILGCRGRTPLPPINSRCRNVSHAITLNYTWSLLNYGMFWWSDVV